MVQYRPGSGDHVTKSLFEDLVKSLVPEEGLSAHDIDDLLYRHGAVDVVHPIEMSALWWDEERRLRFTRSVDRINPGRRSILYLVDLELLKV